MKQKQIADTCILLLIICQLCVTRYRGFVYNLSTVRHEISWICLHPANRAILLPFTQPVAVTGRRYLRNRPVDCIALFAFISLRLAPAGGISATVARLCPHFLSIYLFLCLLDQWWPNSHPVDANYPLLELLCAVCFCFMLK